MKAKELENIKIESLEQGRNLITQINDAMGVAMVAMRRSSTNETWEYANKEHYELRNLKRNVQSQMGKLVAQKRGTA